jgi:hypothetical protein
VSTPRPSVCEFRTRKEELAAAGERHQRVDGTGGERAFPHFMRPF